MEKQQTDPVGIFSGKDVNKEPIADWEEKVDELFAPDGDTINAILDSRGIYDCGKCFAEEEQEFYIEPVKSFIRSLLASNTKQVEERVRKEEREHACEILDEVVNKTNFPIKTIVEVVQAWRIAKSRIINSK